jgi:hypothetical protein
MEQPHSILGLKSLETFETPTAGALGLHYNGKPIYLLPLLHLEAIR